MHRSIIKRILISVFALGLMIKLQPGEATVSCQVDSIGSVCDQQRALLLIQQQTDEAKKLDDPVQRTGIMIRTAVLLWPYQQDAARTIFSHAYDLASEHFQQKGDERRKLGRGAIEQVPDQRFVVMRAIAKRDSAWAKRLAERAADETKREAERAATEAKNEATRASASQPPGINIGDKLLSLAESLLPLDQQAAVNLARSSFASPPSAQLPAFLFGLAEADPSTADQLCQAAILAYASKPIEGLFYLSVYPFALSFPIGPVLPRRPYQPPQNFITSAALQRAFIDAMLRRAEASLNNPGQPASDQIPLPVPARIFMAMTRLESLIAEHQPDYIGTASSLRAALGASLSSDIRLQALASMNDYQIEPPNPIANSFDAVLEEAEREAKPLNRDRIVALGIINAPDDESIERLLDAAKKIGDENVREQIINWTYFKKARKAIKDKQLDDARQFADKVDRLELRAYLSYEIAAEALTRLDDKVRARETLDAVAALAHRADETNEKARALLGLAHLYGKFDPLRAFEVMNDAIKTVNKLTKPDLASTRIFQSIEGKNFNFYASLQIEGISLENGFRELGRFDFDRALTAAQYLEDKSLRATATLALAAACLENVEKVKKEDAQKKAVEEKGQKAEQKARQDKPRN